MFSGRISHGTFGGACGCELASDDIENADFFLVSMSAHHHEKHTSVKF